MKLNVRDSDVERLSCQVRQLQLEVKDLHCQLDVSADKVVFHLFTSFVV